MRVPKMVSCSGRVCAPWLIVFSSARITSKTRDPSCDRPIVYTHEGMAMLKFTLTLTRTRWRCRHGFWLDPWTGGVIVKVAMARMAGAALSG